MAPLLDATDIVEERLTLTKQINESGMGHDLGMGVIERQHVLTPQELEASYAPIRARLMERLDPWLKASDALSGFCSDPRSHLRLSVGAEHKHVNLNVRQYPLVHALRVLTDKLLERWEALGRIERDTESHGINVPLIAAPRKDEHGNVTAVRMCGDFRHINDVLEQVDKTEMPIIMDMLHKFAHKKFFAELDLSDAYMQFWIEESSRKYTSFTWLGRGSYRFVSCPFGLRHIPQFFQGFMQNLFKDLPFVVCYIDNILFASDTEEEHFMHARMILERLTSVNLRIKLSATHLAHAVLRILGHLLTSTGVGMDPRKVQDVMDWEQPRDHANLRALLGFTGFLRDHVRHYADLAAPLDAIRNQKGLITWNDNMRTHFQLLKQAIAHAPWLQHPDYNKRWAVATDASYLGVGGVLYQPADGEDVALITPYNIVAICSKKLGESQQCYHPYKKELWGVVYCLLKFHVYIYLVKFTVVTDHKPLVHLFKQVGLSKALFEWLHVILGYTFDIVHRPGILHILPDAVSRLYSAAQKATKAVWGTIPYITFINFAEESDLFFSK